MRKEIIYNMVSTQALYYGGIYRQAEKLKLKRFHLLMISKTPFGSDMAWRKSSNDKNRLVL